MNTFKVALINELDKMYRKKKIIISIIASFLIILTFQFAINILTVGLDIRIAGETEFPLFILYVFTRTILPLFTALVAIEMFTGEFSNNTMKIAVSRPITRLKLFLAKISAVVCFIVANLMIVMILSLLSSMIFSFYTNSEISLFDVVLGYMVSIIPMIVIALFIILLANFFKGSASAFFMSIILFLFFQTLPFIIPEVSSLLITSKLNWFNLWISSHLQIKIIVKELLLMISMGVCLFAAGYYLFEKRDL